MKIIKKAQALLLAVALVLSLAACGAGSLEGSSGKTDSSSGKTESDDAVITLGYLPITHALAVFEEKELLDASDAGIKIELEKFSSWSDLTDALNSGRIDGASVLIELAMSAVSQGVDLRAVALGHKDGNVIVVSDDIKTVSDLKGKTIAIPHTQSSHNILLNDALAKADLTVDDVEVVQLAPSEMPSSLASGAIAGYCVAEPFGAQAVYQGFGHVLYNSEDLWEDSLCCGLVLNSASIEKLGDDVVKTFVEKYYEAGNKLDTDTAKAMAQNYLGQDEAVLDVSLEWIHYDDLQISKEAYQALTDRVIAYGINDNPPSYEEFVYQVKE